MRSDSLGMFWTDLPPERGRNAVVRPQPPIPETGWRPPRDFPNLAQASAISVDTETHDPELLENGPGWARHKGHVVGVSLSVPEGQSWYFPVRHTVQSEDNLDPGAVFRYLQDTLTNPQQPKIGANLMYDVGWLREEGVLVAGTLMDVQFAEALLDERATTNLDDLGSRYIGEHKETSLLYQWCSDFYGGPIDGKQRANIHRAPPRLVGPYAEQDARLPMQVLMKQYQRLQAEGLTHVFSMECELIYLLVEMRFRGVRVDLEHAEQLRKVLAARAAEGSKKLRELVGFEVNCNAGDSLVKAFDKLQIPYSRTAPSERNPQGNPSFTKQFLENLEHPIAEVISDIRKCDKLRGTFVESYILNSHVNGRVHCQFHPLRDDANGTRSGRFASSDPNLQNIPSRDEELAPLVRGLFLPDEGCRWNRNDYSQIEYRGLVHYAVGDGAEEARARYRNDPTTDYHEFALDLVAPVAGWDVSNKEQRKLRRKPIKNTNFGLAFGMGEAKLARTLGLNKTEGMNLFKAYHSALPFVRKTLQETAKEAERNGYITTILGRRSRFDLWEPAQWSGERFPGLPYHTAVMQYGQVKRAYLHKALNRRLQGSAGDLIKMAMALAWRWGIYKEIGVPHVTVHDELGHSDPRTAHSDLWFRRHVEVLENAIPFNVPIRVESETGPDWGHVE